jgi:hypothetical protein
VNFEIDAVSIIISEHKIASLTKHVESVTDVPCPDISVISDAVPQVVFNVTWMARAFLGNDL